MKKLMMTIGLIPLVASSCGDATSKRHVSHTGYYWGAYADEVVKVDIKVSSDDYRTASVVDVKLDRTILPHLIKETGTTVTPGQEVDKTIAESQFARTLDIYKITTPSDKGVCITNNYPVDLNEPVRSNHLLLLATEGEEINHVGINDLSITINEESCTTLGYKSKWVAAGQSYETFIEKDKNVANGPLGMKAVKDIYTDSYLPLDFDYTQESLKPASTITFERTGEINNSKRATIGRDFEEKITTTARVSSWIDSINAIEKVFIGERISTIIANSYYSSDAFESKPVSNPVNITGSTLGTTSKYAESIQKLLKKLK